LLAALATQGYRHHSHGVVTYLTFADLTQVGTQADRQLIFIDRNRDLYVVPIAKRVPAKLGSMVDSARWHDTTGMLAAMVDQKLVSE
jgi:hypothetical protein